MQVRDEEDSEVRIQVYDWLILARLEKNKVTVVKLDSMLHVFLIELLGGEICMDNG